MNLRGKNMKQLFSAIILLTLLSLVPVNAQMKIAHFNSEAILKELPDAVDAQAQLNKLVADWQQELNKMQEDWKKKFDEYDNRAASCGYRT
jgi:Skp family chaperone for outer membrane proteins